MKIAYPKHRQQSSSTASVRGGTPSPTGECATCRRKRLGIQPKLPVNQPGDKYEREAGRVAAQVMRMPKPRLQRQAGPEEEKEDELLQTKPLVQRQVTNQATAGTAPPIVHDVLNSPGQLLDSATRDFMEPRFGHDFSQVRVHTDARTSETTRTLSARAFTVGQHIAFRTGEYTPGTTAGRKLLAHELTHVLQQGGSQLQRGQRQAKEVVGLGAAHIGSREITGLSGKAKVVSRAEPSVMRQIYTPTPRSQYVNCSELRLPIPPDEQNFERRVQEHLRYCVMRDRAGELGSIETNVSLKAVWRQLSDSQPGQEAIIGITYYGTNNVEVVNYRLRSPTPTQTPTPTPTPIHSTRIEETEQTPMCGPDITDELLDMLDRVESRYNDVWSPTQQSDACRRVMNPLTFALAWDIRELFAAGWLRHRPYHPPCGTPDDPANPHESDRTCSKTVAVHGQCYLAGTVNYALWGKICQLCGYSERLMMGLIRAYKLASTGYTDSPDPPIHFARWAYTGWASPPSGTRPNCPSNCPVSYQGHLDWIWEPHKPR